MGQHDTKEQARHGGDNSVAQEYTVSLKAKTCHKWYNLIALSVGYKIISRQYLRNNIMSNHKIKQNEVFKYKKYNDKARGKTSDVFSSWSGDFWKCLGTRGLQSSATNLFQVQGFDTK